MASKSEDSSRPPLPLPPGVMPSESRQNIEDLLKKTAVSEDRNEILKQGEFGDKENKRRAGDQVEREPVETPAKAWLSAEELNEQQFSSPVGSPLSYHIDLDEKTDLQGSDSTAATTSVKVVEASEDDIDQQRKQLFSLFSAGLKENSKEYPPANTTRSPWRGMTPLRRYNKVAPSPQKMIATKTPTTANAQAVGKENRKQSLQASSESSLLDGSPSLKKITKILKKEESGRPESAPTHSQRSKNKHTSYAPLDTMVVKVEPHTAAVEGPAPVDEPLYSKVMKVKSQQKRRENPYEEPAVSPPASPLSTVAAKLDFTSASHTSDIVQMMSAAADENKVNDSLYDSIRQLPQQYESNEEEATDELQFNPAFYKGLQRHDQAGNIHLIAVRGTSDLLESANVNFTHGGSPGMLPIHYAAGSGNKKALREILSSLPLRQDPVEKVIGSRRLCWREGVNAVDEEGRTPLMHAVHGSHYDCVLMLIEAGANLNAVAADGSTSLHDASYSGTAQMIALLLSLGCNGLIQDTEGRTALHWSTNNRDAKCIEILLDKIPGLHPDVKDKAGMTPLMWAAYNGRPDNVQMLRQKGADTSLVDIDGMRAVHWSVQKHEYGALHVLISPESSQSRDYKGKTVMHQAAEQGCAKAVDMIAAVRPNSVNDLDLNRRTPLHWAAVCENPEAVRGLLANGADPDIKDTSDRTALDYAQERGFHYISLLLCQSMNMGDETSADIGGRPYHRVLSFGDVDSIGVRTLLQQERMSLGSGEVTVEHLTEEQLVHVKSTNTGAWINKFTCEGKGPLHPRFFWIDPVTMRVYWSKSIESRYIHSKDTKSDALVGVRSSASPTILHRKDFDPMGKHKFAFSIFTSTRVLNLVALSSEDFKTWLNGLQLLLYLGSDQATKIVNGTI